MYLNSPNGISLEVCRFTRDSSTPDDVNTQRLGLVTESLRRQEGQGERLASMALGAKAHQSPLIPQIFAE